MFSATTKGQRRWRSMFSDSMVCGSSRCMMSTTRIARSHRLLPRERRLWKHSWPGVSITSRPGILYWRSSCLRSFSVDSRMFSMGKYVAPICCVMPPASSTRHLSRTCLPFCTEV